MKMAIRLAAVLAVLVLAMSIDAQAAPVYFVNHHADAFGNTGPNETVGPQGTPIDYDFSGITYFTGANSGVVHADVNPGSVAVFASASNNGSYAPQRQEVTATFTFDVVFSSPTSDPIDVIMNMSLSGLISNEASGESVVSVTAGTAVTPSGSYAEHFDNVGNATVITRTGILSGFTADGTDQVISSNLMEDIAVNTPVTMRIGLKTAHPYSLSNPTIDFGNTLTLIESGDVFTILSPNAEDITVTSEDAGIVNNHFVPEPSSLVLFGLGVCGLFGYRRWRRKRIRGQRHGSQFDRDPCQEESPMTHNSTRRFVSLSALLALLALFMMAFAADALGVTIPTVPVGNAGNAGDVQSQGTFGAVAYDYRIGTTEVTNAQYAEFLNAKAASDPLGLYNTNMNGGYGGITRSGSDGSYSYATIFGRQNMPVVFVSWYDAIRFANWLHNGQGSGDTETGAYTIEGGTQTPSNGLSIERNPGAVWFLTSEDEWYKAAYHKNDGTTGNYFEYPTSSDAPPEPEAPPGGSNSANYNFALVDLTDGGAYFASDSPYGTFDQAGNVWELNEALISGSLRGLRGSEWENAFSFARATSRFDFVPTGELGDVGFRVATVPEPGTAVLAIVGCVLMLWWRKRHNLLRLVSNDGKDRRMSTIRTSGLCTLTALIAIVLPVGRAEAVVVFTETFNGTFDNTWNTLDDGGTFLTNGFGEQVLAASSSAAGFAIDQDGVSRVIGIGPFEALVEISNPSFSSANSTAGMGTAENGNDDTVFVSARGAAGGTMELLFGYGINGQAVPTIAASANVGSGVERITFKLVHQPDTINGGGIFEALYRLNESGSFISLGSIDGTDYTTEATAARRLILETLAFDGTSYAEFDFAHVVPEPSSLTLLGLAALLLAVHRFGRRR